MSQNNLTIKNIWENVVLYNDNVENYNVLRPEIKESWKRCLENKNDPLLNKIPVILSEIELENLKNNLSILIELTLPIMENLIQFVRGSGFVVALSDHKGRLIEVKGDPEIKDLAKDGNFIPGADWSESVAGTNAISLALKTKKPVQVCRHEHFCKISHRWACSAAPIIDSNKKILGILDMTGTHEKVHCHTLGMVVAAVHAIENQILLREAWEEVQYANDYKNTIIESINEPLLAIDSSEMILHINTIAINLLFSDYNKREDIINKSANLVIDKYENKPLLNIIKNKSIVTDKEISIHDGTKKKVCIITTRPIISQNKRGMVVLLNEISRARNLIQKMSGSEAQYTFNDIISKDDEFLKTIDLAKEVSKNNSNILLTGESGTGKEVFAQAIHNESNFKNGPFISINCGAMPRDLITSELFGYAEGAFTGAKRGGKPGKFELAHNGTIFLDEIGEMPLDLQVLLLRTLEQNNITRIGGSEVININTRIIAATNKNLKYEIEKGKFRNDLYYRLNVVTFNLSPLRERREDIPILASHFFEKICIKFGKQYVIKIDDEVIDFFKKYNWPGNVRELQNVIERTVNVCTNDVVTKNELPHELKQEYMINYTDEINPQEIERNELKNLLKKCNGNITHVAGELGVARSTVYRKLYKYQLIKSML